MKRIKKFKDKKKYRKTLIRTTPLKEQANYFLGVVLLKLKFMK